MNVPGLRLRLTAWRLAILRFSAEATLPAWVFHNSVEFFSITRTPRELSIICAEEDLPPSVETNVQRGWAAFEVLGPLPFDAVGVVSGITAPLAAAGIPVFVISTYDTDYLLVQSVHLERAEHVLGQHFTVE